MSAGNPEGFPWGANCPTRKQRILFALIMALLSTAWWANTHIGFLSDPPPGRLNPAKYRTSIRSGGGACIDAWRKSLRSHGPGLVYHLEDPVLYPVTAFVAVIPFLLLNEIWATMAFLFVSLLMAYGITRDGWHRTPIFVSLSFLTAVWLVQWSMFWTAALFLPWITVFTSVKPQAALPIVGSSESLSTPIAAVVGTIVLFAISLMMLPGWPSQWFQLAFSSVTCLRQSPGLVAS